MSAFQDPDWQETLGPELEAPYMRELSGFLRREQEAGRRFYPSPENIFAAFDATPLEKVRVVIIGQDPYHGPGQAMGLSFSVPPTVPLPPSLRNIFKELTADLDCPWPSSGDLSPWAQRGVLLLNSVLTVEAGKAASHAGKGWERFTDRVIEVLNENANEGIVFLLWGRYAKEKGITIDRGRHQVLSAAHPSPLSARNGFFGCRHFSKANDLLVGSGLEPLDWTLPSNAQMSRTEAEADRSR